MAKPLMVLEEVVAVLRHAGASSALIEKFRARAEQVDKWTARGKDGFDTVAVASGFGANTRKGFVELVVNEQLIQMDSKKAREVGLFLIECSEAAISDEIMAMLFTEVGVDSPEQVGRMLMRLRELRQGSAGHVHPS